jgi:predicted DCC family thiol-disulfide oxidoreductase YuxK
VQNRSVAAPRALILFDGVCHLCNGFVQFVLERDVEGRFDFAPLQSRFGGAGWDSVVLVEGEQRYEAEAAVLRILAGLSRPWPWLGGLLGLLPASLLRWGYRWIARNRYRWFGREETCILPRPEWKGRFLS